MKTAVVLLGLLLHARAAIGRVPEAEFLGDNAFVEAVFKPAPGDTDSGLPKDNPGGISGGRGGGSTQQGKVKCSHASDVDSLTQEEFLKLLIGECEPEPEKPTPEPGQTCERGEFHCTPYHRCRQEDIYSDGQGAFTVRIGLDQYERQRDIISHSECPLINDVCCSNPQPVSEVSILSEEPYVPRCGRRNAEGFGARISGFKDSETQFGEFPWMAVVLQVESFGGQDRLTFVCAGSLVHRQMVLTAAHSVARLPADARLVVRLGEWDTQHDSELRPHEDIAVASVKVHREFHATLLRDDVAMLLLEQPAPLQPHIDTLCLPSPGVNYDGAECVTAGWGKDAMDNGLFQTVLKKAELPHVPRAACQVALRNTPQLGSFFRLDRSFTCAGGAAGEDACKGDGGAPLACRDPLQHGRWVQLGVVSWGIGCGKAGVPGVYADVRRHAAWIGQLTRQVERQQQGNKNINLFERSFFT